ncbi:PepSY-associated TM helix domain-containing protein [Pirellulaceae bacterium SH449]
MSSISSPKSDSLTKAPATSGNAKRTNRKSFLAKQFLVWHWVSSAICLFAMLFFAVTGITLNHAASLSSKAKVQTNSCTLPEHLLSKLSDDKISYVDSNNAEDSSQAQVGKPLPREVANWIRSQLAVHVSHKAAEWDAGEIYISLPRPGGDAWLTIDRSTGEVNYESTSQGVVAYLNDLHKGRNTGAQWAWFIDIFSIACVVFCLTGLGLLWVHAKRRPSTWPVVLAGALVPVLIIIFFVH